MHISQLRGSLLRKAAVRTIVVCTAAVTLITASGSEATALPSGYTAANFTLAQPDWQARYSYGTLSHSLVLQEDGNFVLYAVNGTRVTPLWASGTDGTGVTRLVWSQSGYVKLINSSGGIVCTIGALSPAPGGVARLQSDGNFVFYDTNGSSTWATGTSGGSVGNRNYCFT
ncbi:hypothetical protein KCMC57_up63010 [Kitasatospora sp. CMC57]|uniref:Bulb-type lectin domain-containing protein n=1 Tax=Kitasatospora sp. CMC57 TaxID=3231513 RepID=A0AB33K8B7_9ACTN